MAAPTHIYAHRARFAIAKHHAKPEHQIILQEAPKLKVILDEFDLQVASDEKPVGIIGAGMAGLYTAMIFDSLDIPYEIIEADTSRVGGRVYTKYFGDPSGSDYKYYVSVEPPTVAHFDHSVCRKLGQCVSQTLLSCGERMHSSIQISDHSDSY